MLMHESIPLHLYHCIQEFNAMLQIGLRRTEESKQLFPNGLLHAQTVIVSLWPTEKKNLFKKNTYMPT